MLDDSSDDGKIDDEKIDDGEENEMIYPTEMTVATGTTVYAADPASDERLVSREVRVSVTYRIDEEEVTDMAALARAKAAEVEGARLAASERITNLTRIERMDTASPTLAPDDAPFDPSGLTFDPSDPALEPPDEQEEYDEREQGDEEEYAPDPSQEEEDYSFPASGCQTGNSGHAGNGTAAAPRPAGAWVSPAETRPAFGTQASKVEAFGSQVPEETDLATKPQVLALGSYFKRLGLSYSSQTALLRTRFGKFRPERLTKAEAIALIRSLERGEVDSREYEMAAPAASRT